MTNTSVFFLSDSISTKRLERSSLLIEMNDTKSRISKLVLRIGGKSIVLTDRLNESQSNDLLNQLEL